MVTTDSETTVRELVEFVTAFRDARDWAQFHAPKNLAMSIAIEAAELMEHFQWVDTPESQAMLQDADTRRAVGEELADVLVYCLSLASIADFDVTTIVRDKMALNAQKYPVERYRGRY